MTDEIKFDEKGPIAEQRPHDVFFGKVEGENRGPNPMDPPLIHDDPWFWLRDDTREKKEVLDWLRVEERYLKHKTADRLDAGAKSIYDEHISRIRETDFTAPRRHGKWLYFERTIKGKSFKMHCRYPSPAGGDAKLGDLVPLEPGQLADEEIILDVNILGEGKSQCNIGTLSVDPVKHETAVFTVDYKGDECYEMHFLKYDGATKKWQPWTADKIQGKPLDGSATWGLDDTVVFYTTRDEAKRSYRVWKHIVGTDSEKDELLAEEADELFNIGCGKTLQGDHLIIDSSSTETSECRLVDLTKTATKEGEKTPLEMIRAREFGVRYHVAGIAGDQVYIVTNKDKSINNKVVRTTLASGKLDDWSGILVPHDEEVKIDTIDVFGKFAVLSGRADGLSQLWTFTTAANGAIDPATKKLYPSPEPIYDIDLGVNHEFDCNVIRINYSSLTTPRTQWDFDPLTQNVTETVKTQVVPGYDGTEFVCERRYATGADGTKIPMSIVRKKTADPAKGPLPTLLYGYGSYGICIDPSFMVSALPYTTRDCLYVIAHIRGGGEMGRAWYEKYGKYRQKMNTFQDFICCAETLIEDKLTTPDQLAIEGRSAGGLLIGAVLNMRPDLFKCAIAGVPFVDVMTTMCDPSIPLTTGEWEEWGNPNEHKWYEYMRSYSPLDNVRPKQYPNTLIVAGLHDPRVAYWEPTKWASKLRASNMKGGGEILLKIDVEAGHFSASDRYKYWREKAFENAWALSHLFPGRQGGDNAWRK